MSTLLTFVVLAAFAVGLLCWGGWALLNPFAKVYSASSGTNSGCAGCSAPIAIACGLGAASAAYRIAHEVEPGAWAAGITLAIAPVGVGAVAWRVAWGGVDGMLQAVARQLAEGFGREQVELSRRSAAGGVIADVLSLEAAPRPSVGGSYRDAPEPARPDEARLRRRAASVRRRHDAVAGVVSAVSAVALVTLAVGSTELIELHADARAALAYGSAFAIPGVLGWLWLLRQTRQAERGAIALLGRNPPLPSGGEVAPNATDAPTRSAPTRSAPVPAAELGGFEDGYTGDAIGEGRRLRVRDTRAWGWDRDEEMIWPTEATASSSYGDGFSPSDACGPPRVYPRCGDRPGAWAPAPRTSDAEWLEVRYDEDVPAASAVRVFETSAAGATYAVTVRERGGYVEQVVFARPPETSLVGARILEVPLDPPIAVERVRVRVSNATDEWAEIDTVGLVATGPVPAHERRRAAERASRWRTRGALAAAGLLLVGAGILWSVIRDDGPAGSARAWDATAADLDGVIWADHVVGASSSHARAEWHATQAIGAPDVWPRSGDVEGAWASAEPDAGPEWIEVGFGAPVRATAVLIVESHRPGALTRVVAVQEDTADILFQGELGPAAGSRIVRIELDEPRPIERLRVELDTARVDGWNEIDAIGLVRVSR